MKRVLVTGAAGFLGSHLALHHLNAGDDVMGIDNFCSSKVNTAHYERVMMHKKYKCMHEDVAHHNMHLFLQDVTFDLIYNFACPASPPCYQAMPVETMLTCVVGTKNMLALAKRCGAVVVHASTSEVYGDPNVTPQPESYRGVVNSYGPRACYDEGKRAAEALCFDYRKKHDVDARLVRIFNTYGPHMDPNDGRVVSNFIVQALRKEKLTVYGDGKQGRSFCYVDDLIRGIVALGALDHNPESPINLGNPNEFSMNALAKEVIHQVMGGRQAPWRDVFRWLDYRSLPVDDPTQRCPDITKARELLGWEPTVQLEQGLEKTIEYFREVI